MVSEDEFGAFIAEFEGFRDSVLDMVVELRREVEKLKDTLEDLQDAQALRLDGSQRRL